MTTGSIPKNSYVIAAMILLSSLALSACQELTPEEEAREVVHVFFQSLNALDFETARTYAEEDEVLVSAKTAPFREIAFEAMTWDIGDVDADREQALVEVTITAADAEEAVQQAAKLAEEEMRRGISSITVLMSAPGMALNAMDEGDVGTVETTVDLRLHKMDDGWQVRVDEALLLAMLGGHLEIDEYTIDEAIDD